MDVILDSVSTNSGGEEEKDVDETESNCSSYEETCAKIETALRRGLKLGSLRAGGGGANGHGAGGDGSQGEESAVIIIDVTKLPGYQEVPPNCPTWKRSLIEKKNKQLEEDAMRDRMSKKQEEDRWKDVPEWKRSLIIEKEKKKQDELAPYQAERKRVEGEMERLQNLPEWKRNLIIKKRGDAV